jgi:retron-type reverse transcriptase
LELALSRGNLQAALKRVKKNKGSPGIDGMTVDALPEHLKAHWSELRERLLGDVPALDGERAADSEGQLRLRFVC